MATNRFQFSDDFVLKNGRVGINSADPQAELDVRGTIKADNLTVTGVATFTSYEGFLRSDYNIDESLTITNGSALSGEVIVGTGVTATNNAIDYAGQGQIDSLKVYNTFTPPRGGTEERPTKAKPGQLYYNEDFKTIEFYDGNVWRQVDNTTRSGRMVIAGGYAGPGFSNLTKNIQYLNIPTLGNAQNFGDLFIVNTEMKGCGSEIRGLFGSGYGNTPAVRNNIIEYVTIQSAGNAIDFGDLTIARNGTGSFSSSTRGIWGSGYLSSNESRIDSVQISTLGNALNFGDVSTARFCTAAMGSPTRGVWASGGTLPGGVVDYMDFITIQSGGTAVNFGDTDGNISGSGCSSGTRGVFGGGYNPSPGALTQLNYITISSTGNSLKFGDLTLKKTYLNAASTPVRGVFTGGYNPGNASNNNIDYITFASLGNAQDFGDISDQKYAGALSDSHGGLGGF